MNNIEIYIAQAEKRLLRSLPANQVQAILLEAKEHLTARTAEFVEEGMPEDQAAATAIASFGQPNEWARSIIQSAYQDDRTGKARAVAAGAAGLIMLGFFLVLGYQTQDNYQIRISPLPVVMVVLVLAGGSFRARQAQLKRLLAMGAITALICFFVYGSTLVSVSSGYGPIARQRTQWYTHHWTLATSDTQQEVNLLRLGLQAYQSPIASKPIPTALRTSHGYIVPIDRSKLQFSRPIFSWWSAFKESSPAVIASHRHYTDEELLVLKARMPYWTVPSAAQAAQAWQKVAPNWLNEQQEQLRRNRIQLRAVQQAAAQPPGFDVRAGLFYAAPVGILTAFLLLLSGIGATLGRQAFRLRKRPQAV